MPIPKKLNTILKNAMDNLTPVANKDNIGKVLLAKEYPNEIEKNVANLRFIYYNDVTIRGLIWNNIFTANSSFEITIKKGYENVKNIEEARQYIEDRCGPSDWNLHEIIDQTLLQAQRDRQCFIYVPIIDNQAHLYPLLYDSENYDFMMIPDTLTGKVKGYIQKHPEIKDFSNWDKMKWSELVKKSQEIGDITTTAFTEEEIIHFALMKENGTAEGIMDAVVEKIPDKWKYEGYMLSTSQKTGAIAVVKIGDIDHDTREGKIKNSFVKKILGVFDGRIKKTAVAVPDGVSVDQMSNNSLPNIHDYRRTIIQEIYVALQTPRSMFNTKDSNRSSSETATDTETGYGVFLNKLRSRIKYHFENKLIDRDLSLQKEYAEAVGGIEITYTKDVTDEEPKEPSHEVLTQEDNADLEKTVQDQKNDEEVAE